MIKHVYVATWEHRHGSETRVFRTPQGAEKWRRAIAIEWWQSEIGGPRPPAVAVADNYFDIMAEKYGREEYFSVEKLELEP